MLDYLPPFNYYEAMPRPNFERAPQDDIESLSLWVGEIMEALSKVMESPRGMFISDESHVGDFSLGEAEREKLQKLLGVEVNDEDLIADLARRLKKHRGK